MEKCYLEREIDTLSNHIYNMTDIFNKKCLKKNKKVIISSKKHFLLALCMFFSVIFWFSSGFLCIVFSLHAIRHI